MQKKHIQTYPFIKLLIDNLSQLSLNKKNCNFVWFKGC